MGSAMYGKPFRPQLVAIYRQIRAGFRRLFGSSIAFTPLLAAFFANPRPLFAANRDFVYGKP
jgi:hypothetical protein